jgi:predicted lipase
MWRYSEATEHGTKIDSFDFLVESKLTKNDREDCYSFISEEKNRTVFTFGGTKGNLKSWVKNFLAYPLRSDSLVNTKTGEPGIIHAGFYSIWKESKKLVDNALTHIGDKEIYVTGMSQGGAVATICARHILKNRGFDKQKLQLVTFGAPAQGLGEYVNQVNELVSTHFRVVDGYDIVPTLPPEAFGFLHSGALIWLKVAWWHRFFHRIRDHFYSSYTKGLIRKFKMSEENLRELKKILKRVRI